MWDISCLTATAVFFLVALGYTNGCERLSGKGAGK